MWVRFLGQEDPLEKEILGPIFLPGKSHGQRSLVVYSPQGGKRVGYNLVTKQHMICGTHSIKNFPKYFMFFSTIKILLFFSYLRFQLFVLFSFVLSVQKYN